MKVLKINPNKPEKALLKIAADALENGGLIAYPTDTLYGLGADALNRKAVKSVYRVKGRDFRKPLTIMFSSLKQAKKYVKFDPISLKLARKFLPGPLTLILPTKARFPKELTLGMNRVGVRIPDNQIAVELVKLYNAPITSTSANISGEKDPITVEDVVTQLGDKVNLILDGDKCKYKKPSTIVEVVNGKVKVIRKGVIKKGKLKV
ncbi:MAG: threonylcarbamoyl-AMP synthase [Candidatus Aenigmarchaeota archaeon]|nr:threonylcarbamoyl-AMP synthase [Candidatus Aenigmarchaeota archaeon]